MTQKRIHDYRGPRSSEDLNRKLVGIIPAGIYSGFTVHTDGTIDPGVLFTADGVRIEEDETVSVSIPPGDPVNPRKDIIVCRHQYEQSIPAPEAHYEVIQGAPAVDPEYPDMPDHSILLARATMPQGGIEYSEVIQAGAPEGSVANLAGEGRTDETVKENADGIADLAGDGRTTETVKQNADEIADLAGPGRTTETVKGNADAITNHLGDSSSAHHASAISVQDSSGHLNANQVEAALKEILDAFVRGHYREKDTPPGKHKYPLQQEAPGSSHKLLWEATGSSGKAVFRVYFRSDNHDLFIVMNASTSGYDWTKDETGEPALAIRINGGSANEMALLFREDDADWNMTEWSILLAARTDDDRVYVPSLALHSGPYVGGMSGSPSWTSGEGPPNASEPKGSLYSDTTYGKLYINSDGTSSGWNEVQVA